MKQIFIPTIGYYSINSQLKQYEKIAVSNKEFVDIFVLGLVNKQLGNKANAKEVVSVSFLEMYYDAITNKLHDYNGYLITYLESDMIASKDDLESAWNDGFDSSKEYVVGINFNQWFEENFNNQS